MQNDNAGFPRGFLEMPFSLSRWLDCGISACGAPIQTPQVVGPFLAADDVLPVTGGAERRSSASISSTILHHLVLYLYRETSQFFFGFLSSSNISHRYDFARSNIVSMTLPNPEAHICPLPLHSGAELARPL